MSELNPDREGVQYWTDRYKESCESGEYCLRMLAAAALRELDGVDE